MKMNHGVPYDQKSPLRKAFVYFISDGKHIKIGKSCNPEHRMMSLMLSLSVRLKIVKIIPCSSETEALKKEHKLHNHFSKFRCECYTGSGRTEWFELTEEDIQDAEWYCEFTKAEQKYLEWYVPRLYEERKV